ncbi:antibiotic ABC transporter ATP-binding protein [Niastella yeongjuensis]|uniref:Antibiotic ABC transporter ATP-binding protein n=1 Tax=Niastella yeongjuensis TaxID=354355 RepID=A0A1V9ELN7_9BACT|nr:ABC transporter ATP-binding protein [Niastella yeongjuensis]OQP47060.1 antibiotic ABC transporter ATP-binding protein [Niastella yeongjuensis]SEN67848.1 ATP-binding cassette, subfamily B, MsbA [Niastella yeongjuensis]
MKRFSRIFFYLRDQKSRIVGYLVFNLLSIIFSLVSLAMLAPFLKLLFSNEPPLTVRPAVQWNSEGLMNQLKYGLSYLIIHYGYTQALIAICVSIILSILFKNLFLYLGFRMLIPLRNRIMTNFREDLYNKILVLPVSYFTDQRKGDMMSRMSNDMNEVEWSVVGALEGLIKDPLNIIIVLASLIFLSPGLSLVMLILLPVAGFILGKVSKSLKRQSNEAQEEQGLMLSILDETLGGLRVVKAFNAEKLMRDRFFGTNNRLNKLRIQMAFKRDLASPMSEFLGVMIFCCILLIGGYMVFNGKGLAPEAFITYLSLFYQIIQPAKSLSQAFYNMRRGAAAIDRVEEVLVAPVMVKESDNPRQLQTFGSRIEFKNVTFKYDDITILDNINLTIEKGKTVAFVGSSGAGKSTLADLVPRFHDATTGELLIDGVNIKEYSLLSLRDQMGIVTQEPILFNDTIAANISLGNPVANIAEIEQAARIANAHDFIMKKDENYQTNIGDRGSKLSGGERQRLTIARAVLKNPPILILDEATSSLDTESERLVQDAINKMMENRTSIVIAHRLSTIRHADEIIVLQKGKIVERGTHDTLIGQNGFYRKLVEMQEVK